MCVQWIRLILGKYVKLNVFWSITSFVADISREGYAKMVREGDLAFWTRVLCHDFVSRKQEAEESSSSRKIQEEGVRVFFLSLSMLFFAKNVEFFF